MSDLLNRIAAAHDAAGENRVRVAVPEWDTVLYFKPLTGADRVKIRRGIDDRAQEELMISGLQHKAELEDGSPAFDAKQSTRISLLKTADFTVVMRILTESGQQQSPRDEMIMEASDEEIAQLLVARGADAADLDDLSGEVFDAIRAAMTAREPELAAELSVEASDDGRGDPVAAAKNA